MIIARYLTREIFRTMMAVTIILLFIFMCNLFVKYLGYVASGKYASWVLFKIVLLQVPILLGLLLPLGMYLGILLGYGRLYTDSEMTVLYACGFSDKKLLRITLGFAFFVAIFVGILSLWVQPIVTLRSNEVLSQAKGASIIQTILPKRFQTVDRGKRVYYVEKISRNRQHMYDIFMLNRSHHSPGEGDGKNSGKSWAVMLAKSGRQEFKDHNQYLVMKTGHIYQGVPGQANYRIIHFKSYGIRTTNIPLSDAYAQFDTMPTMGLIKLIFFGSKVAGNIKAQAIAELQWRISVPLSVFILALLALPLCHIKPRQSKFAKIIPAALIYILYANMLFVTREWVSDGRLSPWIGMWWVHLLVLLLALWLIKKQTRLPFREWLRVG